MSHEFRGVLAVLGDDTAQSDAVLERAAAVAESSHGLLTIAALACPDRRAMWLAGLAVRTECLAPQAYELESVAQQRLARAVAVVPATVGLTTLVISAPLRRALDRLLATGRYDLLVIGAGLAGRRACAKLPVPALVVPRAATLQARVPPTSESPGTVGGPLQGSTLDKVGRRHSP